MMKPHEKPPFYSSNTLNIWKQMVVAPKTNIEPAGHQYLEDDRLPTLSWQDPRKLLKNQDCKITLW